MYDERQQRQGHPFFYELTKREEVLHELKNVGYAGTGDPLGNFRRTAAILSNYPILNSGEPLVQLFSYLLKHLDAVLWALNERTVYNQLELVRDRLMDISVYAKLAACILYDDANSPKTPR